MSESVLEYRRLNTAALTSVFVQLLLIVLLFAASLSIGSLRIPTSRIPRLLVDAGSDPRMHTVLVNIRLPQVSAAFLCGAALSTAGAVMQIILHNPLGSPFTLGISNAAAFGASLSLLLVSSGTLLGTTTLFAFLFSLVAAGVILLISYLREGSPEVMVLVGVALSSLFSAGMMLLQYAADDTELAAMVFWTFGDTSRVSWNELAVIALFFTAASVYLAVNRLSIHAMLLGDENAHGIGVHVTSLRLSAMAVCSLVTALVISYAGVIGFVGLAAPHITRRLLGEGSPYYLLSSALSGAILLAAADLVSRTVLAPRVLPVAILTSFLGAPLFIYLIVRRSRR
jgi:iron complex transport system permease protein